MLREVIVDPTGLVLATGLKYAIARSARVGLSYTHARSIGGRRRSDEIDLVAVLDF